MIVLVTGANGLLGRNTCVELLNRGYLVKALVRQSESFKGFSHPNFSLAIGDITDDESLEKAMQHCDYVVHSAAVTSQSLLRLSDYDEVNIKGTDNIIRLSKKYDIKKIIYISTVNIFGFGSLDDLGNEEKPIRKPFSKSLYALSKLRTQELVNQSVDEIDIVTISPTFMIGPHDSKPSSGRIILMVLGKKVLFYPSGGKNFVYVKDVVEAIIKALEVGETGKNYILSNENLSYKSFFKKVTKISGDRPLMIKLPRFVMLIVGFLGSLVRRMGIQTDLSLTNMKILTTKGFYSNQRVKQDLKIEFTPIETAIFEAVEWFNIHV